MLIAIFTGFDQNALPVPPETDAFVIKASSYEELKEFVRKNARTSKYISMFEADAEWNSTD